ncbi:MULTISPECIES: hypothetical protein [Pseudoalteromonas]|uniref:hypothetical protein n=1 Tax=Pseudoalteromonas TaxID=53246 RepID=UPI000372B1DA|nr:MULTISPECIES: hypothetical protein [Pseudoalteromonas]MCF6142578.1 hypothetical protein [Pseudoalteromonas mariniglutinosa NCIMB 1770]MCF6143890.1 hypothetical protein [Pseudoalteromonas mariniglutinosa NCIMB 1770]
MLKNFTLFVIFIIFSNFVIAKNINNQNVLGTWIINHNDEHVDYSVIEYQESGDKCEIAFSLVYSLDVTMYWNKWEIIDGVIHSTMHNTTSFLEYGTKVEDKILTLNKNELFVDMLIPEGEHSTEYHYKNHKAKLGQVCNTVKKYFKNKSKADSHNVASNRVAGGL